MPGHVTIQTRMEGVSRRETKGERARRLVAKTGLGIQVERRLFACGGTRSPLLIPLGPLVILLRAFVVAAILAASPGAGLSATIHDSAANACGASERGLCEPSEQRNDLLKGLASLFFEETSDQFDDTVPLAGAHPAFCLPVIRTADLGVLLVPPRACGDGRANPATGPPLLS
jgi:hypothetical protein